MSRKIRFIINPVSGTGSKQTIEKKILAAARDAQVDAEIVYTSHKGHATELAAEAATIGYYAVVAIGGDGSVNETGAGLVHTQTALGIIPAGSGNGLARHLQIPLNHQAAIERIFSGSIRTIDTARLNGIYFAGVAGIGFEAVVGHAFSVFGKRGFWSYVKVVLREYARYHPLAVSIQTEKESIRCEAFLVSIANSSQYGNNAYISPGSVIDDGMLEVVVVKQLPWFAIPRFVYRLFRKSLNTLSDVQVFRAKKIHLTQALTYAHIDGEPISPGKEIFIEVSPSSLRVVQ